jgi:uncharacterized delta-60 repeat protein
VEDFVQSSIASAGRRFAEAEPSWCLAAAALVAACLVSMPSVARAAVVTPDGAFGSNGTLALPISSGSGADEAFAVAIDAEGRIVAAGYATNQQQQFAVVRLTPEGNLDPDFGNGGVTLLSIGVRARAQALALQSDGKIVLAGYAVPVSGGNEQFAVARLLSDGTPDDDFGANGVTTTAFGTHDCRAAAVVIQGDGGIVLAGWSRTTTNRDVALVRFTESGVVDPTFGSSGKTVIAVGTSNDEATALALQSDGKIVTTGYASDTSAYDVLVQRFTTTGALDPTFNATGFRRLSPGDGVEQGNSVLVQPDGRILIGGETRVNGVARFFAARLNADGTFDNSFGGGTGMVTTAIGTLAEGKSIALTTRDRFVIAGRAQPDKGVVQFAVARYLVDGQLDPTFGSSGIDLIPIGNKSSEGYAVAVDADETITVAGNSRSGNNTDFGFARLLISDCGDGFLDAGEACDGGAGPSCCSDSCTIEPQGTVCRPAVDACDIAEICDGVAGTCPADVVFPDSDNDGICDNLDDCPFNYDPLQKDSDGDGLGDACDPCTNGVQIEHPSMRFGGLQTPGGDDTFKVLATLSLDASVSLSPAMRGVRILIYAADESVLFDVSIPAGAFTAQSGVGWRTSKSGKTALFRSPIPVDGLVRKVRIVRSLTPGRYHVKFVGSGLDLSQLPLFGAMKVSVVLDPPYAVTGICGELAFAGPDHACTLSDDQTTLVCK